MNELGELIQKARKEQKLTQDELGKMLGISGKAVSKWERGVSNPCDEHLVKLVDILDLPIKLSLSKKLVSFQHTAFFSTLRSELIRIVATGVMLAVCLGKVSEIISTDSTVVYLGLSVALFCFGTMIKG